MMADTKLIAAALVLGGCAQQLPAPPPPAPIAAPAVTPPPPPPRIVTLPGAICEHARTAETIMRVQPAAERLIERLQPNPSYGGAWFEHSPCYRIVFALTDDRLQPKVIDAAPEHLRPYIAFARSQFSHAEREAAGKQIMAALSARRIAFMFSPQVRPERFWIGVKSDADAVLARALIPERYRAITLVVPGGYSEPIPER